MPTRAWRSGCLFCRERVSSRLWDLQHSVHSVFGAPSRLKARGGWDILVNSVGYGGLTIYAGWAASGQGVLPPIVGVVAAFVAFFAGFYPLTQVYQMEEDSRRGDRSVWRVLVWQRGLYFCLRRCCREAGRCVVWGWS